MTTIPEMMKKINPADMTTDLDSAIKFCIKHDISYAKMQQAETCVLLKEKEKAEKREQERLKLLRY